MEKLLSISDLTITTSIKKHELVSNIELEIPKNKIVGLIGESGSGKTLTGLSVMNLLPENLKVTSGNVFFNDVDLLKLDTKGMRKIRGKEISMIFQEPNRALHPLKKVGKQIEEVLEIHGNYKPKDRYNKTLELLSDVELKNTKSIYNKYPHQLSGGMNQRIMIAMAIAMQPQLLIADEPTTALDVTIQAQILNLLLNLKNSLSMSILLISHDLAVITQYCDEIYVMYKGRIMEKTTPNEFLKGPKHPYSKALLDTYPSIDRENKLIRPIDEKMSEYFLSVPRVN